VVTDKSDASLENINFLLMLAGIISFIEIIQIKHRNNLVEQDYCFIKKMEKAYDGI
jgi:putative transposase